MNKIALPKKHYSLTTNNDIAEICYPSSQNYGINGFMYARFFDEGKAFFLINQKEYYLYYFKQGYRLCPVVSPKVITNRFSQIVTQNLPGPFNQLYYDSRNIFNLDYMLFSIERYHGYFDMYAFSTTPNNDNILNFYLNNMDSLEDFKFYFKDKATKLIKTSLKNKIIIPENLRPLFKGIDSNLNNSINYEVKT